jgi:cell division protein FtsN
MSATAILREPLAEESEENVTETRSGAVVAVGLIVVLLIGMALGAVVTMIAVLSDEASNPPPRTQQRVAPPRPAPAPVVAPPVEYSPPAPPPAPEPVTPEAVAPLPQPPVAAPGGSGSYVVQAGAFSSRALADRLAGRLAAAGHPATVLAQTVGSRTLNFVLLDERFANRAATRTAVQWLQQNEHITAIVRPADVSR